MKITNVVVAGGTATVIYLEPAEIDTIKYGGSVGRSGITIRKS